MMTSDGLVLELLIGVLVVTATTDSSSIPKNLLAGDGIVSHAQSVPALQVAESTCGKRLETDNIGRNLTLFVKPCSSPGGMRCGATSKRFEYCNGQHWLSMCSCPYRLQDKLVGTRINPGRSCNDILIRRGGQAESGPYWMATVSSAYPFQVFCDMETVGGGWTLVAKVKGNDELMNRLNAAQWRDGRLIGNTANIADENALGLAYSVLQFRDVMIRSVANPEKHLAWRHPMTFRNIQSIVKSCTRVANGVKLSGSIHQLDYKGNEVYHHGCTELVYGFMGGDWSFAITTVAGCPKGYKHGHTGAVIGAFLDPPSGDRSKTGQNVRCVADFGVGGGYHDMNVAIEKYAINAHYWDKGNSQTNSWNSHAVFIRCISGFGVGGGYYNMNSAVDQYAINVQYWGKGNSLTNSWKPRAGFVRQLLERELTQ